ncbi:unnamed protein product [Rhodiola kirilowii]
MQGYEKEQVIWHTVNLEGIVLVEFCCYHRVKGSQKPTA